MAFVLAQTGKSSCISLWCTRASPSFPTSCHGNAAFLVARWTQMAEQHPLEAICTPCSCASCGRLLKWVSVGYFFFDDPPNYSTQAHRKETKCCIFVVLSSFFVSSVVRDIHELIFCSSDSISQLRQYFPDAHRTRGWGKKKGNEIFFLQFVYRSPCFKPSRQGPNKHSVVLCAGLVIIFMSSFHLDDGSGSTLCVCVSDWQNHSVSRHVDRHWLVFNLAGLTFLRVDSS